MNSRWNPRTLSTTALLTLAAVAAVMALRALAAQVYFEPTPDALAAARTGLHGQRVWGAVLAASAFAAAVVTERVLLVVPVLAGLASLTATGDLGVVVMLPVSVAVTVGVAIAEVVGSTGRGR